jgi:hypothetical protein
MDLASSLDSILWWIQIDYKIIVPSMVAIGLNEIVRPVNNKKLVVYAVA